MSGHYQGLGGAAVLATEGLLDARELIGGISDAQSRVPTFTALRRARCSPAIASETDTICVVAGGFDMGYLQGKSASVGWSGPLLVSPTLCGRTDSPRLCGTATAPHAECLGRGVVEVVPTEAGCPQSTRQWGRGSSVGVMIGRGRARHPGGPVDVEEIPP